MFGKQQPLIVMQLSQVAKNKGADQTARGADQTARVHMLIYIFVVCIRHNADFLVIMQVF